MASKADDFKFIDQTPRLGSFESEQNEATVAANHAVPTPQNPQLLTVTLNACGALDRRKRRPLQHSCALIPAGVSSLSNRPSLSGGGGSYSGQSSMSSMVGEHDQSALSGGIELVVGPFNSSCGKNNRNSLISSQDIVSENRFSIHALQMPRYSVTNAGSADDAYVPRLGDDVQVGMGRTRRSASVRSSSNRSADCVPAPQSNCKSTQTDARLASHHSIRSGQIPNSRHLPATAFAVADIGTQVLRQTGAYPGFKQLQKVRPHSHSQSLSNAYIADGLDVNHYLAREAATISRHVSKFSVVPRERLSKLSLVDAALFNKRSVDESVLSAETAPHQDRPPDVVLAGNDSDIGAEDDDEKLPVIYSGVAAAATGAGSINGAGRKSSQGRKPQRSLLDSSHESLVRSSARPEVGYRLGRRKQLYETRRRLADYTLVCALFGIALAALEMEATLTTATAIYLKNGPESMAVKAIITLSTLLLLALEITYHVVDVQLFCIDNCIEDWRVAIDCQRILRTSCELIICSVHPFPGAPNFLWTTVDLQGVVTSPYVSVDVVLTLPMFLRLYLIFRVMLLHSKLFTDASSRSIGAMNRIKFNIRFVLKTLMTLCPGTVLLVLILSLLVVASWSIRVCEGQHKGIFLNMLNSLWFIAITFMSIGYGDIVPQSICGRLIATFTGMMGSGCMALVVAVVARKLELTRAEKHVHNFMMDNQLAKSLRNSAANVLRETWLIYKYTRLSRRISPYKVRYHQRKFFDAIQALRKVKLDQRKLADHNARLVDLPKLHHQLHDTIEEAASEQQNMKEEIGRLSGKVSALESLIASMPQAIATQIAAMISEQLLTANQAPVAVASNSEAYLKPPVWAACQGQTLNGVNDNNIPHKFIGVGSRDNSLNSNVFSSADTVVNSVHVDVDKAAELIVTNLDQCDRQIARQSSCASQPVRRMSKLAEMPDAYKSHSAVA